MTHSINLVCEPNHPSTDLLFAKVAGIPLLLRNILSLNKAGFQNIGVSLPPALAKRFQEEIAPQLEKKKIHITPPTGNSLKIPAHALVEGKLAFPHFRLLVDSPLKIAEAEKLLMETIRLSTPGPVAKYLNKRISLPISLRLGRIGLHPHWITLVNMLFGISSGFFVAEGTYFSFVIGTFIFQWASIFDGCDGEVAKLTFKTSKFGQYFDSLSDNGALISFFIGLIAAFAKGHNLEFTLGVSALLLVGLGGLLWQMIQFLKKHTQSASLATYDKEYLSKLSPDNFSPYLIGFIRHGKTFMRKDCFSLFFFVFALVGLLPWLLYLAIGALWITNGVLLLLKQQPAPVVRETNNL